MQDPKGASYSSSKFDLNLRYWSSIKGKADEGERRGKVGTKRWRVEVNNNHGNGKYDFGSFLFSRAIRAK